MTPHHIVGGGQYPNKKNHKLVYKAGVRESVTPAQRRTDPKTHGDLYCQIMVIPIFNMEAFYLSGRPDKIYA